MGRLTVAVIGQDGLDGPEDVRTLEGHISLDSLEHRGSSPLFLIFHWQRASSGADAHSVSVVDNLPRAQGLIDYYEGLDNMGVNRVLIMLPPNAHTAGQWIVEDFEHAEVTKEVEDQAPTVIYTTVNYQYRYLMNDFKQKSLPDWRIILKNL